MWIDKALSELSDGITYSREDLLRILLSERPELSDATFRWTLYNLLQERKIFKAGYDIYITSEPDILPVYKPLYTDKTKFLNDMMRQRFPEVMYVMFESVLLNEFLNHQIAQNTIYVQVEKDVSSYFFDTLKEEYKGCVLYNPSKKEFDRYWIKDCIVVLDLISQSPLSVENPHEMTIEKMLVDIISEKSISAVFSPSEIPSMYANVINSYQIDRRKLNRYAGRRGKTELIKKYTGGAGYPVIHT